MKKALNYNLLLRLNKVLKDICLNVFSTYSLYYIIENANWSIKYDGINIIKYTNNNSGLSSTITTRPYGLRDSIVHFGSINTFIKKNKIKPVHKSNKIVVTWFHITPRSSRTGMIDKIIDFVDIWHTSNQITKTKLIQYGVPENKIVVIPLGVNLEAFKRPSDEQKSKVRHKIGIPSNKLVIGSFQKDGTGWGSGMNPKPIKGPDLFCDVVEHISKKYDIFVLLTGPSRGYVMNRLEKAGIPYHHHMFADPDKIAPYYHALDLYLVTSRVEGGPKSILESMASGVPVISTRVGMAPDIIKNNINGIVVEIDDLKSIINSAEQILSDRSASKRMIENAYETIQHYDWSKIAKLYYDKIYSVIE